MRTNPRPGHLRPHSREEALARPGEGMLGVRTAQQGLMLASVLAAATAIGAQCAVYLPWNDKVPVTLQTFFVLSAGLLLGPRWGLMSQAEYLAAGLLGTPVFAGWRAGPAALLGPTGGYLVGFLAAAWVAGRLSGPRSSYGRSMAACVAAALTWYAAGVAWLYTGWRLGSDWHTALAWAVGLGALPFIGVDLMKAALACGIARSLRRP